MLIENNPTMGTVDSAMRSAFEELLKANILKDDSSIDPERVWELAERSNTLLVLARMVSQDRFALICEQLTYVPNEFLDEFGEFLGVFLAERVPELLRAGKNGQGASDEQR